MDLSADLSGKDVVDDDEQSLCTEGCVPARHHTHIIIIITINISFFVGSFVFHIGTKVTKMIKKKECTRVLKR
jgi:hypothetical protein